MEKIEDIQYYITNYDYVGFAQWILDQVTLEFILYALVAYFFVIWVAVFLWVARDIMSRTRNWFYQILCILTVLVGTPLWVFVYLIIRPGKTLLEKHYDENMYDDVESEYDDETEEEVEKLHNCFSCHREVDEDFKFCPYCSTQLKTNCTGCHKEIQTNWNTCPYCWVDQKAESSQTSVIPDKKNEIIKQDEMQNIETSSDTGSSSSD